MCLKQISSHFTITSHKEKKISEGRRQEESSPSLFRVSGVLAKALIVLFDDPSLVLPFGYIFIREKLQNFARVYTRNTHRYTKSFTKTRASWSLFISLPFVPKKAFCLSAFLSIARVYKVNVDSGRFVQSHIRCSKANGRDEQRSDANNESSWHEKAEAKDDESNDKRVLDPTPTRRSTRCLTT